MFKLLKKQTNISIVFLLVITFLLFHYFIYLNNSSSQVPLLQSYTDSPVHLPELVICEEKRPTYLNPFRKVTFSYRIVQDGAQNGCVIRERATSFFTSEMEPIQGDPYDYWDGFEADGFPRPQIGYDYANILFFIVQYVLIATALCFIIKAIKTDAPSK